MRYALFVAALLLWALPVNAEAPRPTLVAPKQPVEAVLDTKAEYIAYATEKAKDAGISVEEVLGTIECESHWNTRAVSPTNDYGLSQINQPTWKFPTETMFDPKFSIDFLVHQFKAGNQRAWVCWKKLYA